MATRKKTEQPRYYSLNSILGKNADYNIIFGERSNGKTYAALAYGIENYVTTGKQMAYIRRWREDLRGKRADSLFANHTANGFIEKVTGGKYNEVFYMANKWYLSYFDAEKGKRTPDTVQTSKSCVVFSHLFINNFNNILCRDDTKNLIVIVEYRNGILFVICNLINTFIDIFMLIYIRV